MKTIKAIISVVVLGMCMAAQAQQAITVKSKQGKEAFMLNRRVVLVDSNYNRSPYRGMPFVHGDGQTTYFRRTDTIVMYVSSRDEADGIVSPPTSPEGKDQYSHPEVYDLGGRKVQSSMLMKGIYIQNGKKIAVK